MDGYLVRSRIRSGWQPEGEMRRLVGALRRHQVQAGVEHLANPGGIEVTLTVEASCPSVAALLADLVLLECCAEAGLEVSPAALLPADVHPAAAPTGASTTR